MTLDVLLWSKWVFFVQVEHFFYLPFVVKYIFGLEATSRVEKSNILLRGKKYYYSRKNVRGCDTFAFLVSYGIGNFCERNFLDKWEYV
jgi:hypothetical protein